MGFTLALAVISAGKEVQSITLRQFGILNKDIAEAIFGGQSFHVASLYHP
jgi:hypothetical protein